MEIASMEKKMGLYPKLLLFSLFAYFSMGFCLISVKAELIEPTRTISNVNKQKGKITVLSEPAGFDVLLDGNEIGKTPIKLDEVEPGHHTLKIKDSEIKVYIEPGKSLKLSFFKGSFVEISEKEKDIKKQPKKEEVSGKQKQLDKKKHEIKYEPLYWPLNPTGPIF